MKWTFNEYYDNEESDPDNAKFKELSEKLSGFLKLFNFYILMFALSGFLINFVHFIIITRRPLRTNSVYVLMIGITSSDLYTMFDIIYVYIDSKISISTQNNKINSFGCDVSGVSNGFIYVLCGLLMNALGEILRRVSTWLALFMALFRFLIVQYAMSSKLDILSTPKFAIKTIITTFLISSIITTLAYIGQFSIVDDGLRLHDYCDKPKETQHSYVVVNSRIFDAYWPIVVMYSLMSDGITKVRYPILHY